MTRRRFVAALPLVIAVSMSTHAATRPSLPSAWRTSDIVVDGSDAEWTVALAPIAGTPLFASIVNDDDHVFVRLRVTERAAMEQLVRGGLLVWFDAKGGDARTFGIKYPVSAPPPNPESDDARRGGRPGSQGGNRGGPGGGGSGGGGRRGMPGGSGQPPLHGARERTAEPTPIDALIAQIPNRLEVYGPKDDDIRSLVLAYATGLSVSVSRVEDVLVYELAVPLKKDADHPFAIGTAAGATLGIGFQSPKIATSGPGILSNLGGLGSGMSGGRPGGGMGGPGGGGGGGRVGGPPRDDPDDNDKERKPPAPPKPFTTWQTLVLAAQSPR